MNNLKDLWIQYNVSSTKLVKVLGRTYNIVGEYAEHLVCKFYKGQLSDISEKSHDVVSSSGHKYQVKSRKMKKLQSTSLNVIRSWDFDFLIIIIFDSHGEILKALEIPATIAKEYGKYSAHQHGYIITTSKAFLSDKRFKDLTSEMSLMESSELSLAS